VAARAAAERAVFALASGGGGCKRNATLGCSSHASTPTYGRGKVEFDGIVLHGPLASERARARPSADDFELAVPDDSSATAALSLPWVPSTRGELKEEDCPNLACKLSVRWAHQSRLGEGCERVFLDVGANIGLHGRFLFEPEKFPRNSYHTVFESVFGADWKDAGADAKMRYCVLAFEPNPAHRAWHVKQATSYQKLGWKYVSFFVAAGAGQSNETLTFYEQDHGAKHDWGFSVKNTYGGPETKRVEVPFIDLAAFLLHHFGHRDPYDNQKILMKMDIEGSEFAVLPSMIQSGVVRLIHTITAETHVRFCLNGGLTLPIEGGKATFDEPTCKKMARELPGLVTAAGAAYLNVDDESYSSAKNKQLPGSQTEFYWDYFGKFQRKI
jgi:hypothetical protein